MKRRNFLATIGAVGGTTVLPAANSFSQMVSTCGKKRPNLLFVFPDQFRASAIGVLGEESVKTPVLDRFAEESLYLSETVSNYPTCSPFRAMLMSGQYPETNGVMANCAGGRLYELNQDARCWSDILSDQGYSLGYIGKWHLDAPHEPYVDPSYNGTGKVWNEWCSPGRRHGFDFWYAYGSYNQHLNPLYWDTKAGRDEYKYVNQWEPAHDADMAIHYLENRNGTYRNSDSPFALVVAMNPPHPPYSEVPQEYISLYDDVSIDELSTRPDIPAEDTAMGRLYRSNIKKYYGMISGVDEQFGRILEALDANGLAENTIVVFTSDHGNCLGIHNQKEKNNSFEESFRIPFFIRWPGKIKPGRDLLMLSAPDIYPTLLGLMGFSGDIPSTVQGKNYSGLLIGQSGVRPKGQLYFRGDDARGWRDERYTLEINAKGGRKLFDRQADPYQMKSIAAENTQTVDELTQQMKQKLMDIGDSWVDRI